MSATATRIETMETVIADLWRMVREISGTYAVLPDGVGDSLKTAKAALQVLEGQLRKDVLEGGGVHGSAEAAWGVWQDLAISTGDNLTAAAGYAGGYTLTGYIQKAGGVLASAAQNIASGGSALLGTIKFVAVAAIIWAVISGRSK